MLKLLEIAQEKALRGEGITSDEAAKLCLIPDNEVFDILPFTDRIRQKFHGQEVNLCSIVNAKSGLCKEDCSFCSQSVEYETGAKEYSMIEAEKIIAAAKKAKEAGAREFSIVTSGTKVAKDSDVEILSTALKGIGKETDLEKCASLGIMDKDALKKLKDAGLESFHHNLETGRSFFPSVCTTHDYEQDVRTVREAKKAGFYVCSGGIFGMGEKWADRIELAETLQELDVDSVPVNFLNPRPGTPLEKANNLTPRECLKTIALLRFMLPTKDIVVCGGRGANLRSLQSLIFAAGANGMMIGDYLTTKGGNTQDDLDMLTDLGLKPRGKAQE